MLTDRWTAAPRRRGVVAVAAVGMLLATGLAPAAADAAPRKPAASRLPAFPSCQALLRYAQAGALRAGGGVGVPIRALAAPSAITRPPSAGDSGTVAPTAATAEQGPAAAGKTGSADEPSFSTTNNQEAGVDEPDVVKTDGRYVYAVTDGTLRILDVTQPTPAVVGTLKLDGYGQQLLLRGKRLLVLASVGGYAVPYAARQAKVAPTIAIFRPGAGKTLLTEVDVSTPSAPKVARSMTVDGDLAGARLTGGTARVIVGSTPAPIYATDDRTLAQAVRAKSASAFVPRTVLRSALSGKTYRRPLVKCGQVRHPRSFSGTGMLTVMTVDLDRGLYSVDRDGIMAGAQVVYGSTGSIYVASQQYSARLEEGKDVPDGSVTEIHRFDASTPGVTTYRASGTVPGFVLNQYALSEDDGRLRVASTEEPLWFPDGSGQARDSSSRVTVLAESGSTLAPIGTVKDLGHGQRIYAVRFAGDAAYVVTFRQIDPLYVVDLSRPTAPRVRGELEITGYSAYLHPLGDGLLLGVGQDATSQGRTIGAQVSLFDVSDADHPKRLAHRALAPGSSSATAEYDPHAFLYWPATKLVVLPVTSYAEGGVNAFAAGFHVDRAGGITEAGRVTHPGQDGSAAAIDRSLVAGGKLYTLSYAGLGRSALDTLKDETFTAFPAPEPVADPGPQPAATGTTAAPPAGSPKPGRRR